MTLPMPVATKGGSIGLNPRVALSHDLLGNPSARELAQIIVFISDKTFNLETAQRYLENLRS
ncbi:3-hydroxy-3-methylglutaryl-coenzyme a reductase [Streptococcus pneumoniae]|nr:3-hydroxy-3-methylglutaryl-coenzyme a reductase [Streptococcus pneumoniae]